MAPPPTPKCPTTVLDLDDDLLREVFIRLPALPSLVRAALTCRTFLRAVRSSRAFRRRFRALHPSPFVGLFIQRLWSPEIPSFDAHLRPSDPDFAAAVRGGDFALTGLPLPVPSAVWEIQRCCDGYVVLFNQRAKKIAAYNPLTRALHLFPSPPKVHSDAWNFEFHIISSQEDPGTPVRVVCFYSDAFQTRVGVISSDSSTYQWQISLSPLARSPAKMVNGSVYWTHTRKPYMTVFNTATLQFTKMDLPPLLAQLEGPKCAFVLGNTKDGRPCIVFPDLWGDCSLDVFVLRRDEHYDGGVEEWILDQTFPLKTIRQFVKFSEGDDEFIIVRLVEVVDGIVYLHTEYYGDTEAPELLLSFCLETAELKKICEDYHKPVHPYIMAWPPSLGLCSKDQALSTPSSEGTDVKAGGGPTQPASVAKA